jgi:hypothetical protein
VALTVYALRSYNVVLRVAGLGTIEGSETPMLLVVASACES